MSKITVYHNVEARFMPYQDGQRLDAVASHWLPSAAGQDPPAVADWVFYVFNADLDMLEGGRCTEDGELVFLAACVYRLMRHRSLSVGDVVEVQQGQQRHWLACEPAGWRAIAAPANVGGQPLTAATVYQHLANRPTTR